MGDLTVYLQYELNESGKGKFLRRLIPALADIGVGVQFAPKGADVCLGISKWRDKLPNMPRILRIDGIYFRKGPKAKWRNDEIRKSMKKAHAVIFQSKWYAGQVCEKLNIRPKKQFVIHNGAPKYGDDGTDFFHQMTNREHNVLFCANWGGKKERKDKHLKWHLDVARQLEPRDDIAFWLVGETPYKVRETKNLGVLGPIHGEDLLKVYASSDLMVYLSTPDCCPNTVVECLCCGTAVLCLAGCGVEELVEPDGGWAQPDLRLVPQSTCALVESGYTARRPDLYIENVAKRYKEAFIDVCENA